MFRYGVLCTLVWVRRLGFDSETGLWDMDGCFNSCIYVFLRALYGPVYCKNENQVMINTMKAGKNMKCGLDVR